MKLRKSLVLLAMGASTFGLFGSSLGIDTWGQGCYYPTNADYQTMFQTVGNTAIQDVSDNYFGAIGTDYDAYVRNPTTTFAQAVWGNWLNARVPDDPTIR